MQRPEIEPIIYRDLFLFRTLASFLNGISLQKLGCNAELIVDEFGEKLLEELDYTLVSFLFCFSANVAVSSKSITLKIASTYAASYLSLPQNFLH